MCTSRRSLEMSIPTKSWFMTRPCECGLWRPKRLYGFEVEPVSRAPGSVTVFCGDLDVHGLLPTLPLAVPTTEGDGKIQGVALPRRREGTPSQRRRWAFFSALLAGGDGGAAGKGRHRRGRGAALAGHAQEHGQHDERGDQAGRGAEREEQA